MYINTQNRYRIHIVTSPGKYTQIESKNEKKTV